MKGRGMWWRFCSGVVVIRRGKGLGRVGGDKNSFGRSRIYGHLRLPTPPARQAAQKGWWGFGSLVGFQWQMHPVGKLGEAGAQNARPR